VSRNNDQIIGFLWTTPVNEFGKQERNNALAVRDDEHSAWRDLIASMAMRNDPPTVATLMTEIGHVRRLIEHLIRANERTIEGFCYRQSLSRSHFYNLRKAGRAPRISRCGRRLIITSDAEVEWQRSLASVAINRETSANPE
jgi:predicted DNA-binding transcriptional regulator AlpA